MKPENIVFAHFLTRLPGVSYTHAEICPVVKNYVSVGLRHACVSVSMMKSFYSLNDRSKLNGQILKVDAVHKKDLAYCKPHSLSLKKILVLLSL